MAERPKITLPSLTLDDAPIAAPRAFSDGQMPGYGDADLTRGFQSGVSSLKQSLGSIGAAAGVPGAQKFVDQEAIRQQMISEQISAAQSFADVRERGIGALPGYIGQLAASSAPEILTVAAPGGIAAALARRAGLSAAKVGANVGAAATFPSGTGQAFQAQYEASGEYSAPEALAGGAAYAALTRLSPVEMTALGMGPKAAIQSTSDLLGYTAKVAGIEGATELLQDEAVGNVQKALVSDFDLLGSEAMDARTEALVGGALLGGTVGGAVGLKRRYFGQSAGADAESPTGEAGATGSGPAPAAPTAPQAGPRIELPNLEVNLPERAPLEGYLMPRGEPARIGFEPPALPAPEQAAALTDARPTLEAPAPTQAAPGAADFVVGPDGQAVPALQQAPATLAAPAVEAQVEPAVQAEAQPAAEPAPESNRAQIRKFLFQNKIRPGSKVGQMALNAGNMEALADVLAEAGDKAGNENTFAPIARAFQALTGQDLDTFLEQRREQALRQPAEVADVPDATGSSAPVAPADGAVQSAGVRPVESPAADGRAADQRAGALVAAGPEALAAPAPDADQQPALTEPVAQPPAAVEPAEPVRADDKEARQIARELFDERAQTSGMKDLEGNTPSFANLDPELQARWEDGPKTAANFRKVVDALRTNQRTTRVNDRMKATKRAAGVAEEVKTRRRTKASEAKAARAEEDAILADMDLDAEPTANVEADDRAQREAVKERLRGIQQAFAAANKRAKDSGFLRAADLGRQVTPENKNAFAWLNTLFEQTREPRLKELLTQLGRSSGAILRTYSVEFGNPTDEQGNPVAGKINHTTKTIEIGSPTVETVLHEIFHAALDGRVVNNAQARAMLDELVLKAKGMLPEGTLADDATETRYEFLNYYFTSPTFRAMLEQAMPERAPTVFGQMLNLAKRAVRAFVELLGYNSDNLGINTSIDKKMQGILRDLLSEPARDRQGVAFMRTKPADFGTDKQLSPELRAARAGLDAAFKAMNESVIKRVVKEKTNRMVQRLMTMGNLVDSYGDRLPALKRINDLRVDMERMTNDLNAKASITFNKIRLASRDAQQYKEWVSLSNRSTVEGFRLDQDINSPGNAASLTKGIKGLEPEQKAEFDERRREALADTAQPFRDAIEALEAAMEAEVEANPDKTKADVRRPFKEKIKATREARDAALADVRQRFEAEMLEATAEQRAERRATFERMKAEFDKMPADFKKLYTENFEHFADVHQREYETLVAQAMRAVGNRDGLNPQVREALTEVNDLQRRIAAESDPDARAKLSSELSDLLNTKIGDPALVKQLKERRTAITELRSMFDNSRHAYLPLMRFGDYVVVARSSRYKQLEADLEQAKARLEALEKASEPLQKVNAAEINLSSLEDQLAATKDDARKKVIRDQITALKRDIAALRREAGKKVVNEDGTTRSNDLVQARVRVNQLQYEIRQARKSGADYSVQFFDSEFAAQKAADVMNKEGLNAEKHLREEFSRQLDGVGINFITKLREETKGVDNPMVKELNDLVMRMYLQNQPESSALKRRMIREGIEGYSDDMLQVFAEASRSHAFYISRIEYADQVAGAMSELRDQARAGGSELEGVYNTIKAQQQANLIPGKTPVTDALTRLGAFWYLGITPAFLALNLTQNFVLTWPNMAARYGVAAATKHLGRGVRDAARIYSAQLRETKRGEFLDFEINFENSDLTAGEKSMIEFLQQRGLVNFTQTVDMVDRKISGDLNTAGGRAKDFVLQMERLGWYLPHHTEVFNRTAAALAAYRMAVESGSSADAAKAYAAKIVETTHGDYAESNKPQLIRMLNRIPGGKLLTLFKSYQQMMLFNLFFNARKLFREGERAEGAKALAAIMGVHAGLAGAMGLPGANMVFGALDLLFDDEDEPFNSEAAFRTAMAEMFGKDGGEVVSKGILRAIPVVGSVDFASRVGLENIFSPVMFADNPAAQGRDKFSNMLLSASGPVGGIVANLFEAEAAYDRGAKATEVLALMTPKAMADVMRGATLATSGAKTRSGADLYDPTTAEVIGQILGFRPARSAESGEARRARADLKAQLDRRETQIKNRYIRAVQEGDVKARRRLEQEAREFYRKNPDRGNVNELRQSLRRREKLNTEMAGGRRLTGEAKLDAMTDFASVE